MIIIISRIGVFPAFAAECFIRNPAPGLNAVSDRIQCDS
jgi:hypothetical protein